MADEFAVDTADLRTDAETWRGWQERLAAVGTAVPLVGTHLDQLAFSTLPGAQDVAAAYARYSSSLAGQIEDGSTAMGDIAQKLTTVAGIYEDAEQSIVDSMKA
ncbi:type VII secretion target [Cellulomonas composti]|uniref:ESX-1 secretion-associated protein n=1 Tax=Cellulomonas composti TaxID=266130 RepID=A0A511J7Y7_9CELL|nr:type VII secretion target [Cellulomonas composti]GEL94084.1 hypothetical protein CCO02nite_07420 [Cellulomonas composti]